jgi:hypothetical protein
VEGSNQLSDNVGADWPKALKIIRRFTRRATNTDNVDTNVRQARKLFLTDASREPSLFPKSMKCSDKSLQLIKRVVVEQTHSNVLSKGINEQTIALDLLDERGPMVQGVKGHGKLRIWKYGGVNLGVWDPLLHSPDEVPTQVCGCLPT